jgi:thiamine-monophosphate kinase
MRHHALLQSSSDVSGGSFGERRIIEAIRGRLDIMPELPVEFGDDVSAVNLADGSKVAVLKTDMLVAATDVPAGMSFWQAGRKAVIMNISDFAAKGVAPVAALVSLGLPNNFPKREVEAIASGLNVGAREYGTYVIGGDTNEASDVVIAVFLFGTANPKQLMLRKGAKVGDIVAVSGVFGNSAAGLRVLLEKGKASRKLRDVLVNSVLMPCARLKEGLALANSGAVSASIDSSDGLAWCLHELSRVNNVGFILDNIPMSDEVRQFGVLNGVDALDSVFYGGEEYELVVTVKPKLWADAASAVEKVGGTLLRIGEVTSKIRIVLKLDGKERLVEARGWEHFKSKI